MHPNFSSLFVHPQSHKPLAFFGNTEEGKDVLRYGYRPGGERWTNGFLWAEDTRDLYPVIDGIPVFALPPDQTWGDATEELRGGRWIEKNWEGAEKGFEGETALTEFLKRMAEGGGVNPRCWLGPWWGLRSQGASPQPAGHDPDGRPRTLRPSGVARFSQEPEHN